MTMFVWFTQLWSCPDWAERGIPELDPLTPVWNADLSVRASKTLMRLGCQTLKDASRLTSIELLGVKNCGMQTHDEIVSALRRAGLHLHQLR